MKRSYFILFVCIICSSLYALSDTDSIKESYYKSYSYEKMGNYTDAIKVLEYLYNQYPDGYTLNYRLGYLEFLNLHYANSLHYYEKAMKLQPTALDAKTGYLSVLIAQEKFEKAETIAYQIVNSDYYNYYGNLNLSYIFRMENKLDLAEQISLKMLAIYPIDTSFLNEYGIINFYQENYDKSASLFESVIILDPENVTAKEFLNVLSQK